GRVKVYIGNGHVAPGTSLDVVGPGDNQGNPDAPFVVRPFSTTQWCLAVYCCDTSIVGGEDDQGILSETETVQGIQQVTDVGVHIFDHSCVPGLFYFKSFFLIFLDEVLLPLEGGVDRIKREVKEKGIFGGG